MAQSLKQEARRRAAEQFQQRRAEQLAREGRIKELVIEATTAWLERAQVLTETRERIVAALDALEELQVPAVEAAALCGLEPREVARLRKHHAKPSDEDPGADVPVDNRYLWFPRNRGGFLYAASRSGAAVFS